jgi:hypothetical protein
VLAQFEVLMVEAPGFSPAKQRAIKSGFSRDEPGLKPGSVVAAFGTAEAVPFRRIDFKLAYYRSSGSGSV